MTLKVYGMYGKTAAIVQLPVNGGKAFLPIEFENGNIANGENYRPATFSTNDKVKQIIIENSSLFKCGEIKLVREYKDESEEETPAPVQSAPAPVAAPVAEEAKAGNEYPEVTTIEQARAVLKANGAKATTLASAESMSAFMQKKNISFPNFTL